MAKRQHSVQCRSLSNDTDGSQCIKASDLVNGTTATSGGTSTTEGPVGDRVAEIKQRASDGMYARYSDELFLLGVVAELKKRVASYEHMVGWDTSCSNCATLLDSSYADYERANTLLEQLTAAKAALAELVRLKDGPRDES